MSTLGQHYIKPVDVGVREMSALTELKKRFLELLDRDEEFRLAVAAKIGLLEILSELKRLREDFNKLYQKSLEHDKRFEAIERKLLEHDKRFEEINKRFEVIERKLLEHDKRFEEINKRFEAIERKLLEHDKRLEAIEKRLEEHDRKFNEILEEIKKIWETLAEHNRRLSNVEDVLGALAESTYAKFTLDSIMYECAHVGDRVVSWQRNARVDNEDIDLLVITEKRVYVVEVKVRPKHSDVGKLLAKAEIVKSRFLDKEVVPILTGTRIGSEVLSYALGKGVRVYSW